MFENLMQVEHPNIVKFHKYWLDMKESQARVSFLILLSGVSFSRSPLVFVVISSFLFDPQVIFITEYMSSGSLKQFLKKTKKNHKTMNVKVCVFTLTWGCFCMLCPVVAAQGTAARSRCRDPYLQQDWI